MKKIIVEKYTITTAPKWTDTISNAEIVDLIFKKSDVPVLDESNDNSNICYVSDKILRTSDEGNEDYSLLVYRLNSPEVVQIAAISDYALNKDQRLVFHRLGVIRNRVFIDKISDQNVRILDNEQQSSQGSTTEAKKVNCVINDLRIGDIFILEFSIVTDLLEDSYLDRKYYRNIHDLPQNNWLYKKYNLKIIQNRKEDLLVKKRFFRDEKGDLIKEEHILHTGDSYTFEEIDFQSKYIPNVFSPFFEIATVASWESISHHIYTLFESILKEKNNNLSVLVQKIITSSDDIETRIQKVIEYVQDQIIYIYDSEEMHGHIPQSSGKTLEVQAGDCKAKSLLLIKLLEELSIKSSLILVNYEMNFYGSWDLPSPFIFNHAVVKIYHNDQEYYIDPTWQGRKGLLDKRAQPYFGHYLEVNKDPHLQLRKQDPPSNYGVEENITIDIKKGKGKIVTETIYRFLTADRLRHEEKQNHNSYRVQAETQYLYKKLEYPADKNISDYIVDAKYEIVSDNFDNNEVKDSYTATLLKPYLGDDLNIIKFYSSLGAESIINFQHLDSIIESYVEFGRKTSLTIRSDRFINEYRSKRNNLVIDNKYFYFSNRRKFYFRTASIVSEYKPKTFEPIAKQDLEIVKKAYKQINDSNFGIGILYLNGGKVVAIFLVMIWIFWSIIKAVLSN